jgi:hypothetical protein
MYIEEDYIHKSIITARTIAFRHIIPRYNVKSRFCKRKGAHFTSDRHDLIFRLQFGKSEEKDCVRRKTDNER